MVKKLLMLLLVLLIVASSIVFFNQSVEKQYSYAWHTDDDLLLLMPYMPKDANLINGWTHAAQEIGLHLEPITDQQFIHVFENGKNKIAGVILPDILHRQVSNELFNVLTKYIENGGQLMLVYDAGTSHERGKPDGSLFSKLLGFSYAQGDLDNRENITIEPVGHTREKLVALGIPPGKCISVTAANAKNIYDVNQPFCAISGYSYGALEYSHFNTAHTFSTQDLLLTTRDNQFIAGVKAFGRGRILFVNLPLTNLWMNTDSMFLHTFLRYFAENLVQAPILLAVPNGIGGIILNIHTEDLMALQGFELLKEIGLFQQGPYSIDVTAGPGVDSADDGKGLDVPHNQNTRTWIRILSSLGNEIGSDGGWLHNYYGLHANENNEAEFLPLIKKNNEALEQLLGKPVKEYMPSVGNQPHWATRYLERSGFVGYYSVGNTGSGPTQNFRGGIFDAPTLWSFPVLPLGSYACIRDFGRSNVPVAIVREWFEEVLRFVANNHSVRLVYFHPPDVVLFPEYLSAVKSMLQVASALHQAGQFQWYTMVNMGDFLNKRRLVDWRVEKKLGAMTIKAQHPVTLSSMTWLIKKTVCEKPVVIEGIANIREDAADWIITAGDPPRLSLRCQLLRESQ